MRALQFSSTLLLLAATASADGNMDLVSIGIPGASAHGDSNEVAVSADGRYVVFASDAPDLVLGDTNGIEDVFVRDMQSGITTRISVSSTGGDADGPSGRPNVSADGNIVVFESDATNLVSPSDLNSYTDVYRHDRSTGQTTRISTTTLALETNGDSDLPAISADGAVIAYRSEASNLVSGDTNSVADVFVSDPGGTARVSLTNLGAEADSWSGQLFAIDLTGDGQQVLFGSAATNLVVGDTNGWPDIFVRDRAAGTTERVNLSTTGVEGDKSSRSGTISADGNVIAYDSAATNLVPGDTNNYPDCFVHDRAAGTLTRISVAEDGTEGTSYSRSPFISADGSVVCFESLAPELADEPFGSASNVLDTFHYVVATGALTRVSEGSSGPGNDGSFMARPIANGGLVAMASNATNFDPVDTNGSTDIFLVIPGAGGGVGLSYCDSGSSIGCPCGNNGAAGEGCANGTGSGAVLSATGNASASSSTLVFSSIQLIGNQPGLYFQGNNAVASGQGIHFGDGLRCAGGAVIRLQVRFAASDGTSATTVDIATKGGVSAGDLKRYQIWYRDPNTSSCGALFNLSNGLEVTWGV